MLLIPLLPCLTLCRAYHTAPYHAAPHHAAPYHAAHYHTVHFPQGLLGRPDWDTMRHTPLAQVPCGSGNALAASVGMWSVDTALHAIIKGQQLRFDIASGALLWE